MPPNILVTDLRAKFYHSYNSNYPWGKLKIKYPGYQIKSGEFKLFLYTNVVSGFEGKTVFRVC